MSTGARSVPATPPAECSPIAFPSVDPVSRSAMRDIPEGWYADPPTPATTCAATSVA